jgi:hypothetical protein
MQGIARKRLTSFIVSEKPIPVLEEFSRAQDFSDQNEMFILNELEENQLEKLNELESMLDSLKIYKTGMEDVYPASEFFYPNNNCEIVRALINSNQLMDIELKKNLKVKDEETENLVLIVVGCEGPIVFGMFKYLECRKSSFFDGDYYYYKIFSPRNEEYIYDYTKSIENEDY